MQQIIQSERLRLRPTSIQDASFLLDLFNEPDFLNYVGDRKVRTLADAEAYILSAPAFAPQFNGVGYSVVELRRTREQVGICGLLKRDALDAVDVGYAVLRRHRGKGYASEALDAVLNYAREELGTHPLFAFTAPENAGSRRLLEKAGLTFQSMRLVPGYNSEVCLYSDVGQQND